MAPSPYQPTRDSTPLLGAMEKATTLLTAGTPVFPTGPLLEAYKYLPFGETTKEAAAAGIVDQFL